MKLIHALPVVLVLLASCQGNPPGEKAPVKVENPEPTAPIQWVGLYADTLPCADCPGILTQLDLRADSTYVMRDQYLERDSIPYGTIGEWTVSGELLTLRTADVPMKWRMDGSKFVIPVAMDEPGVKGAGLELERVYMKRIKTAPDPLYVEVVATLRVGPAMEGDDTEEYLYIERLERVKEKQACP